MTAIIKITFKDGQKDLDIKANIVDANDTEKKALIKMIDLFTKGYDVELKSIKQKSG